MHDAVSQWTVGVVLEAVNAMQANSKDVERRGKKTHTCLESIEVSNKQPDTFELAEKLQRHKAEARLLRAHTHFK